MLTKLKAKFFGFTRYVLYTISEDFYVLGEWAEEKEERLEDKVKEDEFDDIAPV